MKKRIYATPAVKGLRTLKALSTTIVALTFYHGKSELLSMKLVFKHQHLQIHVFILKFKKKE